MSRATFVSTRGDCSPVDFETAIFSGYAPDGGLYVPSKIPPAPWQDWKGLSYRQVLKEVLNVFLDKDTLPLEDLLDKAYGEKNFPNENVAEVKKLAENFHVLELFHGPTWSFKDYALMFVGEVLQYLLSKRHQRQILLVATSGDTGSSAMHAVRGKPNIDIIVLLPLGRVSEIQRRQMTLCTSSNIHLLQGEGNSDELDVALRPLLEDADLNTASRLIGSINSINVLRILVQIAHWFYAYHRVAENDQQVLFAVPCGACGNITAGLMAQKMGLPVKMVACTGPNDIVAEMIRTGRLRRKPVRKSLAPAIDIQMPYNVERLFFILSEGKASLVKKMMDEFGGAGDLVLPDSIWTAVNDLEDSSVPSPFQL